MYELIYRNRIIGYTRFALVGQTYMGRICWQVDYKNKIAYLTD